MIHECISYGVNKSFLKGSPSVMTVYMTTAAIIAPKKLKIILPIMTKEDFLWDRFPCLKGSRETPQDREDKNNN